MVAPNYKKNWISWRTPFYGAIAAIAVMLLSFVYSSDPVLDYMFVAPAASFAFLVLLMIVAVKMPKGLPFSVLTAFVFLVTCFAMLRAQDVIRPSLRWFLWSRRLKTQILAQPIPVNYELRHIEWDGWGGAWIGDWTAYVVYDPTDALLVADRDNDSGTYHKYEGIPCKVQSVHRLENHWYSAVLGVDEWWDRCGESSSSFGIGDFGVGEKSETGCSPPLRCGSE